VLVYWGFKGAVELAVGLSEDFAEVSLFGMHESNNGCSAVDNGHNLYIIIKMSINLMTL